MRNLLISYAEERPRGERYSYRRRSLSPDEEDDYYVSKPEISRDSYVSASYSKHRSRADRHDSKRHRRRERSQEEREYPEFAVYEVEEPVHQVYSAASARHEFRSSSHDTSFLWRSRSAKEDSPRFQQSSRRFSHSYSHLPVPEIHTSPEKRVRSGSGSKHHRPVRYEEDRGERRQKTSRYLEVPKPQKQYSSWEVYEIV
ncbi:hypothetical protein ABW19_dt0207993 [Dactylella cylindrospora]|nr:hypothetical protein ABW19_dt0207993 [Dactylella cylindrospora]